MKRVALAYEAAYLHNALRNASGLTSFGVGGEYTTTNEARIVNRSGAGVYVRVRMTYTFSTENSVADLVSEALYLVTIEDIRRVRGSEISV